MLELMLVSLELMNSHAQTMKVALSWLPANLTGDDSPLQITPFHNPRVKWVGVIHFPW